MGASRLVGKLLLGVVMCAAAWMLVETTPQTALAQKKKEKNPLEGKKGKMIGTVTAKGDAKKRQYYIEVKAPGEEKARRYFPRWVGGAPAKGGGPEKSMLKTFSSLKVGSRVEVDWEFQERLRAVAVKVLKAPKGSDN